MPIGEDKINMIKDVVRNPESEHKSVFRTRIPYAFLEKLKNR